MATLKVTLKDGRVFEFYDSTDEYYLSYISTVIDSSSKCIYFENVLFMKDQISTIEIY